MRYKIIKSLKDGTIFPILFPMAVEDVKLIGAFEVLSAGSMAYRCDRSGSEVICLGSDNVVRDSEFIWSICMARKDHKRAQMRYESFSGRIYVVMDKAENILHGPFSDFQEVLAMEGKKGHVISRSEDGESKAIRRWDMGKWRKFPLDLK